MAKYWYKPTFWQWWWQTRVPAGVKALAATVVCALLLFGGYESLGLFSSASAAHVYTYVQTVRHVQVEAVTSTRPITVLEHGRIITVDPPPRTVAGPTLRELVTVTTSGAHGETRIETVPVMRRDVVAGPGQTVSVITSVPVTRTETVGRVQTVPVTRVQTATVGKTNTLTVQRTGSQQTVVAERTVTQTEPVTVTKAPATTTVAKEVTTTVVQPTTQTVNQTQTTTVSVTTTVTRTTAEVQTITQTVLVTVPVTITVVRTLT